MVTSQPVKLLNVSVTFMQQDVRATASDIQMYIQQMLKVCISNKAGNIFHNRGPATANDIKSLKQVLVHMRTCQMNGHSRHSPNKLEILAMFIPINTKAHRLGQVSMSPHVNLRKLLQ